MKIDQKTMKVSEVRQRALQCYHKYSITPLTQEQKEKLREEKYRLSHGS